MPEIDVFAAVASPVRRQVLGLLRDGGPRPVQQLAEHFDMRSPSLSEHLKVLREAGLVIERREGRSVHYRAAPGGLTPLVDWIDHYGVFWRDRIGKLAKLLKEIDP